MLDVVRKREYFHALAAGHASLTDHSLKGIQDGWILGQLGGTRGKTVIEIGGGNSRVIPRLEGNSIYLIDKYEGVGHGPKSRPKIDGVTIIDAYFGEFDSRIPTADVIFSISVVEHVPFERYDDFFADICRCLKPGGVTYHAIDLMVSDKTEAVASRRIEALLTGVRSAGLVFMEAPSVTTDCVFTSDMASHSDLAMFQWSRFAKAVEIVGPTTQAVSLKLAAMRPFE